MKICLLTAAYPTSRKADSGSFIRDQAIQIKKMNCDIVIVVPRIFIADEVLLSQDSIRVYRFSFLSEEKFLAEYERIPIVRVASYLISGIIKTWRVVRSERVELIHAHWVIPTGLIGVVVGKYLSRKPVVITAHRADITVFPQKSKLARLAAKFVLRKADYIVAVSEVLKEKIRREYGIGEEKMTVINMGVNKHLFKQREKKAVRQKLGLPKTSKIVLFAGGLIRVKGLAYLMHSAVQIIKAKHDTLFILVGTGSLEEQLKDTVLKLGISAQVRFVGERPHAEVPLWINSADVVVLPSFDEGLPMLIMEALASGVPVVATCVGGTPEVIKDSRNGFLVEPRNVDDLAKKITSLITDDHLYKNVAENCKLPKECDMESNARRMVEIYSEALRK